VVARFRGGVLKRAMLEPGMAVSLLRPGAREAKEVEALGPLGALGTLGALGERSGGGGRGGRDIGTTEVRGG